MKLLGIFCLILVLSSCTKKPEAEFTASKNTVDEGEEITFTSTGKNVIEVEWDFGDGTKSTMLSPTKTYDLEGSYTVKLTAFSKKAKKTAESSTTIKVVFPKAAYVKGIFGGVTLSAKASNNIEAAVGGDYEIDSQTWNNSVSYDCFLYNNNTSETIFLLHKGTLYYSSSYYPSDSEFENFFTVGPLPYSVLAANGMEIKLWENGIQWSSSFGSADQTGSIFKIVKKTPSFFSIMGDQSIGVKCEFNCKMYNENGASKTFSGTCVMYFSKA